MKKVLVFALVVSMLFGMCLFANAEDPVIKVILNGQVLEFDQPPVLINDRTLVPFRKIFEALEAEVTWQEDTETAIAKKGNTIVMLTIGKSEGIIMNEKETISVVLDSHPALINDRTLVPLRFVSESLNMTVVWDEATSTVTIDDKK